LCEISVHWYHHIHQYACFVFFVFKYVRPICLDSTAMSHIYVHILMWVCL
jgi:hypothetical protein